MYIRRALMISYTFRENNINSGCKQKTDALKMEHTMRLQIVLAFLTTLLLQPSTSQKMQELSFENVPPSTFIWPPSAMLDLSEDFKLSLDSPPFGARIKNKSLNLPLATKPPRIRDPVPAPKKAEAIMKNKNRQSSAVHQNHFTSGSPLTMQDLIDFATRIPLNHFTTPLAARRFTTRAPSGSLTLRNHTTHAVINTSDLNPYITRMYSNVQDFSHFTSRKPSSNVRYASLGNSTSFINKGYKNTLNSFTSEVPHKPDGQNNGLSIERKNSVMKPANNTSLNVIIPNVIIPNLNVKSRNTIPKNSAYPFSLDAQKTSKAPLFKKVSRNGLEHKIKLMKEHRVASLPSNTPSYANLGTKEKEILKNLPCSCFWSEVYCGCNCNGSLSYDDYQELALSFRPCQEFQFSLVGGEHYSLPPSLFSRVGRVRNFSLSIQNATFEHFLDRTPGTSPFRNVEADDASIRISGVAVRRGWNWTNLQKLRSLKGGVEVEVRGCGLRRLSSDFAQVAAGDVASVSISDSRLAMVGSGAFATFAHLQRLRLPDNRIRDIKRVDMPPAPQQLNEIDLRNNELSSLEADLFSEMPSLKSVYLGGNPLRVIAEQTFGTLLGNARLPGLSGLPLQCDCKLRWLRNSSVTLNALAEENLRGATCRRPPHLRGIPFGDLAINHLIC